MEITDDIDGLPSDVFTGVCPDEHCRKRLSFFKQYEKIECSGCGQTHLQKSLKDIRSVQQANFIQSLAALLARKPQIVKKGTDSVKVNGLSNYHCKILSPFLTRYGMDKHGEPKLLTDLGRSETFDCSILGSRAFILELSQLDIMGFGRDQSGSSMYLHDTLSQIYEFNDSRQCLIPIHADGDGHCLVHAISRALVGRELFWHALRENLREHFVKHVEEYRVLFKDFVDEDEWSLIINECQPNYVPLNDEPMGMRNIHIFGLANVLHRPIILLDSLAGMQSLGDYTGVFLPCLVAPDSCRGQDGLLNKPLCIAWSSLGRNHYIPLVALKQEDNYLPRLPRRLLPQVWGVDSHHLDEYIEFDDRDSCIIGGDKSLKDAYIQRLASAMDKVYAFNRCVQAADVADVHQYICKASGLDGSTPEQVLDYTRRMMNELRLYRCLTCDAVSEFSIDREWLVRGGYLYKIAVRDHGTLKADHHYVFGPPTGVTCDYDEMTDSLVPDFSFSQMSTCNFCQGSYVRRMLSEGGVEYKNGDKTRTPARDTLCQCGFKHWWNGYEYDNLPEILPVTLEWNGQTVRDEVCWWQFESDTNLNSNVYMTAQLMVQKHFPGEFGSERLVQRVVDSIIRQTTAKGEDQPVCSSDGKSLNTNNVWQSDQSSKIILVGPKKKTFHKEELTMSKTEQKIRSKTGENAKLQQKRKTTGLSSPAKISPRTDSTKKSPEKTMSHSESAPALSSPKLPRPSPSAANTTSEKKVKVQTSDGRQGQLSFTAETTFDQLQAKIHEQFAIPPSQQKIRHGFPPKELQSHVTPLPVQHGDKLIVEIMKAEVVKPKTEVFSTAEQEWAKDLDISPQGDIGDWFGILLKRLAPSSRLTEQNLEKLFQAVNEKVQSLDITEVKEIFISLTITVKLACPYVDIWTVVQKHGEFFDNGGLFYRHISDDKPMEDGYKVDIPLLNGKSFRYKKSDDRLEVYVDPYGYYPVEKQVEDHVTLHHWRETQSQVKIDHWKPGDDQSNSSNSNIRNWTSNSDSAFTVDHWRAKNSSSDVHWSDTFQGQGHSLTASNASMDTSWNADTSDWGQSSFVQGHNFKGQGQTLGNKEVERKPIPSYVSQNPPRDSEFRRLGPGYSVLTPSVENQNYVNQTSEEVKAKIANCIDVIKASMYAAEDDESDDVMTPVNIPEVLRDPLRPDSAGEDDEEMHSDGSS